ncbi:hypothetical protein CMQ_4395 [Grosmannia clavigera kw1407]|uniref:rRNA-processing protein FYV7 n=1 Tax=Grosmannia clavigera (strain kw1407 / UAMH 11150) TaxID=655863 RepID=F0XUI4_GROCL|nr:uncharacterized protein CMQ_4395 [Grosmannia clavigera kw1407]EFW98543.1 hypothetical protein CMQ_4395 [Grosmannia clavigera kw1407]
MVKRPAEYPAAPSAAAMPARKRSRLVGAKTALPVADEAWRAKMMRTKDAVVLRAKTRKNYAKIKARTLAADGVDGEGEGEKKRDQEGMHPDRQARLGDDEETQTSAQSRPHSRRPDGENGERRPQITLPRAQRRPSRAKTDTLLKAQQEADQHRAEAERRAAEREEKRAERTRMQKAMVRARRVDGGGGGGASSRRGGQLGPDRRKLGRESEVLLDRVRRLMK